MNAMVIIGILIGFAVLWFLLRRQVSAPDVMTYEQLINEGMTPAQARRELRAQRNELRNESVTQSQAIRTASSVARFVSKIKL